MSTTEQPTQQPPTSEQMMAIGRLAAFYGRYPGLRTTWSEDEDGSIHFQASYLVPVDESDTEGTHPETQWVWIAADGELS